VHNDGAVRGGDPLAIEAREFATLFPELTLDDLVAARQGEVADLSALCRERAEQRLSAQPNPLGLVGSQTAAALLGVNAVMFRSWRLQQQERFPVCVAIVDGRHACLVDDVRTYDLTGRAPRRKEGELNDLVLGHRDVARELASCR